MDGRGVKHSSRFPCQQVNRICKGERTMRIEIWVITGACTLLTIGTLALFSQVIKLGNQIKALETLVYHVVKGHKVEVVEDNERTSN